MYYMYSIISNFHFNKKNTLHMWVWEIEAKRTRVVFILPASVLSPIFMHVILICRTYMSGNGTTMTSLQAVLCQIQSTSQLIIRDSCEKCIIQKVQITKWLVTE